MLKRKSEMIERWNKQIKISSPDANVSGCVYVSVITGKIKSIELLEGDREITDAQVVQYVNIQQNKDRYVDGTDVPHVDRLGQKLRLKVKFDIAGRFAFKVRLTSDGNNVSYSAGEKARNSNFLYSEGDIEFITEPNGEKVIEADKVFVSPAGGDIFTISAVDTLGYEITAAAKVKNLRLLYYVEFKMRGLTSVTTNIDVFTNEYAKHGIQFKAETLQEIPYRHNIKDYQERNGLLNDVMKEYFASASPQKSPYCFGIVYTGQLATKKPAVTFDYQNIMGGGANKANFLIVNQQTKSYSCLWHDVDLAEDWFVDCYFIKNGGTDADKVSIPKNMCTISTSIGKPAGFYNIVEVDLSAVPTEIGKVVLTVDCVDFMKAGEAARTAFPIAVVCTRAWWTTASSLKQNNIIIHEVAHKLEMVSDGSGKLPDSPPYYYLNRGHVGRHCHKGLPEGLSNYRFRNNSAQCVMYGSLTGLNAFCDECGETVRKLDFADGLR